jgi:Zn-dependent peptidase ImmA (M78 family)
MKIGERIRRKRIAMGFSQRELSGILGLGDHTMLAKIESGLRFPKSSISVLAKWLGIEEGELRRLIDREKVEMIYTDLRSAKEPSFLPVEKIEEIALEDRRKYLEISGDDEIKLPEDREKIIQVLFDLKVYYENHLFGPTGESLYGGLFPEGCYYHDDDKVIVINTHWKRGKREDLVPEETKTFQVFHEAGHYRLHLQGGTIFPSVNLPPDRPVYCSAGGKYKPLEFQANVYASAFLIPREGLKEIIGRRTLIDLKKFEKILRQEFGVSKKTILYRLRYLGIRVVSEK